MATWLTSLLEWGRLTWKKWWAVMGGSVAGSLGILQQLVDHKIVSAPFDGRGLPFWVWYLVAAVALLFVSFTVFHELKRRHEHELQDIATQHRVSLLEATSASSVPQRQWGEARDTVAAEVVTPPEWAIQVVEQDIYLAITNHTTTRGFRASVENIDGTYDPYPSPFPVRWHEHNGEHREIQEGDTNLLYLVRVDPKGNEDEYPVTDRGAKQSVSNLMRHWKPGRFRFMGLTQEHPVYLDLGDRERGKAFAAPRRYDVQLRVVVRVCSTDTLVNETRTVVLGLNKDDTPFVAIEPGP